MLAKFVCLWGGAMIERIGFLPFPALLSCPKHRCDSWSYSGNYEAILRTKITCQGQQTRKTKVAWMLWAL